mmetsp:Transcript_8903/g.13702  ORF Transcript_8903/g.13702 Transcript_8903/m.13702 type:complete len:82 (+) Transcript_8903:151-396(+)
MQRNPKSQEHLEEVGGGFGGQTVPGVGGAVVVVVAPADNSGAHPTEVCVAVVAVGHAAAVVPKAGKTAPLVLVAVAERPVS